MELSNEQRAAVETTSKKVLVGASSGSGKTRVITERINYLLSLGEDPDYIVAITFTNMAAQEMLERVNNKTVLIGTIHGLANKILVGNGIDTSELIEDEEFDQLLILVKNQKLQYPYIRHLLVDEFQDISDKEFEFFKSLNPENTFYCGDSAQAIYGFRSGNFEHFMNLIKDDKIQKYFLTQNYRSGENIIYFAEQFVAELDDIYYINTTPMRYEEGKVSRITLREAEDILSILEKHSDEDWFILTRSNNQLAFVANLLDLYQIPFASFKKSEKTLEEIKDIMSTVKIKVLTVHTAKGLEATNVLTIGLKTYNNEEKRVCYVGYTRAKDNLYVAKLGGKLNQEIKNFSKSDQLLDLNRGITMF